MHICLVNQFYAPDVAATAQLATDLCEELVRLGHSVSVVTSARRYAATGWLSLRENVRGVEVYRVPTTSSGRASVGRRLLDAATFFAAAAIALASIQRPDVVVVLTSPPFVSVLGALAKQARSSAFVYWVMDVYPEVAIRLGTLHRHSRAAGVLDAVAGAVLRRADAVIALDEPMRDLLVSCGAPADRTRVIDNWCTVDIAPRPIEHNPLRARLGIGDSFTISYSGNFGLGHDVDTVLNGAVALRDADVHWLFIGGGPRRKYLEAEIARKSLRRVTLLDYQPLEELQLSLTAAHVSLVTLRDDMAGVMVPSKLYGILAAGIPVLYVGPPSGRAAQVVADFDVGIRVPNGDASALTQAILTLEKNKPMRFAMSRASRRVYEEYFTRQLALRQHVELLSNVARGASSLTGAPTRRRMRSH